MEAGVFHCTYASQQAPGLPCHGRRATPNPRLRRLRITLASYSFPAHLLTGWKDSRLFPIRLRHCLKRPHLGVGCVGCCNKSCRA